jgi:chromosome segregation ATPase
VKPMKILRFPLRNSAVGDISGRIASLETLLSECMSRQSRFHEDGRRLKQSLDRLAILARSMARDSERLKRSAARLRACRPRIAPKPPAV